MLDGALHACGVALSELQRQVAAECRERGELLAAVSSHMVRLMITRSLGMCAKRYTRCSDS